MNFMDLAHLIPTATSLLSELLARKASTSTTRVHNRPKFEGTRRTVSIIIFLLAVLFAAVGIASEREGAHWIVGVFLVLASLSCSASVIYINSPRPDK